MGASTYLDQDVEILLANAILCLSKWGFGLNFTHMKFIVKDFLLRNGTENNIVAHTAVISSISITSTRSPSAKIPVSLPIPVTQDPPTSDQDCLLSPVEKASKDLNFSILKHLSFNLSNKKKNT